MITGSGGGHCRRYIVTEYLVPATIVDNGKEQRELGIHSINVVQEKQAKYTMETSLQQLYDWISIAALVFGPTFQTLQNIQCGKIGHAFAFVQL